MLDGLPSAQREAVRARVLDEREYEEIARELRSSTLVVPVACRDRGYQRQGPDLGEAINHRYRLVAIDHGTGTQPISHLRPAIHVKEPISIRDTPRTHDNPSSRRDHVNITHPAMLTIHQAARPQHRPASWRPRNPPATRPPSLPAETNRTGMDRYLVGAWQMASLLLPSGSSTKAP